MNVSRPLRPPLFSLLKVDISRPEYERPLTTPRFLRNWWESNYALGLYPPKSPQSIIWKTTCHFLMTWVLLAVPLPSSDNICYCLVCTRGKEVDPICLDALDTAWMVPVNVSNMVVLSIPQFKDDNSVGFFSISLSLAIILLASGLIYTPLRLYQYIWTSYTT